MSYNKISSRSLTSVLRALSNDLESVPEFFIKAPTLIFNLWFEKDAKQQFINVIDAFDLEISDKFTTLRDLEAVRPFIDVDETVLTIRATVESKDVCEKKKVVHETEEYVIPTIEELKKGLS